MFGWYELADIVRWTILRILHESDDRKYKYRLLNHEIKNMFDVMAMDKETKLFLAEYNELMDTDIMLISNKVTDLVGCFTTAGDNAKDVRIYLYIKSKIFEEINREIEGDNVEEKVKEIIKEQYFGIDYEFDDLEIDNQYWYDGIYAEFVKQKDDGCIMLFRFLTGGCKRLYFRCRINEDT